MISSFIAAQALLDFAKKDQIRLTPTQLHRLVFFAHAIHLGGFNGRPLINEPVKAWRDGPMIPELFNVLKALDERYVPYELPLIGSTSMDKDSSEYLALHSTWATYKVCTEKQLIAIAMLPGTPWDQVWNIDQARFRNIDHYIMKGYYSAQIKVQAEKADVKPARTVEAFFKGEVRM